MPNRNLAVTIPLAAVASASIFLTACTSSTKTSASVGTNPPPAAPAAAAPSTTTGGSGPSNALVTVSVATIPGVGSVLVNGDGQTLYVLASEQDGKVTCTTANGCTKIWPPAVLPSGMAHGVAGSGVQASLLGTVQSPSGELRLTYAGWPLYTFTSDTAAGRATGQGVKDVWGLWWVLAPSGSPVTTSSSSPSTSRATAPASGGAGF